MARAIAGGLLVLAGLVGAVPAHAQVAASSPASPGIAELVSQADDDLRLIEGARRRAKAADPAERLARQLAGIADPVDFKLHAFDAEQLRKLPVMRQESLERHWKFDAKRFDEWQVEMRAVYAPYAGGPPASPDGGKGEA
jgi:hypothetical protein